MLLTFLEQILGVPPALVEQGWRRAPTQEVREKWLDAGSGHVWDRASIGNLTIYRPVQLASGTHTIVLALYSHAGWGEGLAPTPEMVKVWKWWWISREDGPQAVKVAPSSAVYQGAFGCTYKVAAEQSLFLGPVLPPVRQS